MSRLNRRAVVTAICTGLAMPSIATAATLSGQRVGPDRVWLHRLGVNEEISIRLRHDTREDARQALGQLSWFFRDWKDRDRAIWIDPNLPHILAELQTDMTNDYGSDRIIQVTSGYRTRERNSTLEGAVPGSMHVKGGAADIIVPGYSPRRVKSFAIRSSAGGIGTYPGFTHVDTARRRFW